MIVTRFAPSPTGLLHLGHAFAALTAVQAGERFILRIEDIDTSRTRVEFVDAIFGDLAWLGLRWEEPVLRQSTRFDAYRAALAKLEAQGLLYPCFCTRADIAAASEAPHGPEGPLYPGTCHHLNAEERASRIAAGAQYALRLDVAKAAAKAGSPTFKEHGETITVDPLLFGDIVLARKDTPASYHLAVVVDDAFQDITLVTRGIDLLPATHVQRLLQTLLDLPEPSYAHHRLILDDTGKKFSKRDHAVTLRDLCDHGVTPEQIRERLSLPETRPAPR
jgi:glutamyl-Q tRNA(Asp) synthetase